MKTLKRTINGERVLIGIDERARNHTKKLVKALQGEYLALWRESEAGTLTEAQRSRFDRIDRLLGKARAREYVTLGTWN